MSNLNEILIQYIKGVGPAKKKVFENLGVATVEDLLYLFPRRYEDRRQMTPIAQLKVGEVQSVCGRVMRGGARQSWYTRKHVYETMLDDKSGRVYCVWFNQPYLQRYFTPGTQVIAYGKAEVYKNRLQMIAPEYEIIDEGEKENLNVGRIVPIYPLTRGVTQRYLRKTIRAALDRYKNDLRDILPVGLRNKHRLHNLKISLENIHFPEDSPAQEKALWRISFEEFFLFQISVIKRRMSIVAKEGVAHTIAAEFVTQFEGAFPFSLTGAQKRVIREIAADMQKFSPMLRLLQGDVGSGKTLMAVFGCVAAWTNGCQSAIMAPTEILARQHYANVQKMFKTGPFKGMKTALLLGNLKKSEKDIIYAQLKEGEIDLLIGTHALLSEPVDFKKLSFVVIDEQHKFGVRQRALLSSKATPGRNPDVLVMTATPIPRTLSLTLYGDLDISTLDEVPSGRGKIETQLYPVDRAAEVYQQVGNLVKEGQQAYIVYPIIEESEKLDLKAAEAMYNHFLKHEFKNFKVGIVHGQLKRQDVDQTMQKFKNGEIQILVATTVLEVGVDVPQATVMVIEHAQRFGLSQLHQLRGRIGRGAKNSICFLIADLLPGEESARLKTILSTTDGFKIAQQDLLIRGPGHYFGRHQHGLNELRFANPLTQLDILELARQEAIELSNQDPQLAQQPHRILKETILKRYPDYLKMVEAA